MAIVAAVGALVHYRKLVQAGAERVSKHRLASGSAPTPAPPPVSRLRLFDARGREHNTRLAALQGAALRTEADTLAERIDSNSHPIYTMLFDLQVLGLVHIIEARD